MKIQILVEDTCKIDDYNRGLCSPICYHSWEHCTNELDRICNLFGGITKRSGNGFKRVEACYKAQRRAQIIEVREQCDNS
jgi:hypothetical protein